MRIAHVTLDGGFPRYGIGLAVLSLAKAQSLAGHDVVLCVRAENAESFLATTSHGVRVAPLTRRRGLFGGRRGYLRQIRDALAPSTDVVHVHTLVRMAHWLLPARARGGAPLVVTAHASDELGPTASPAGDASPSRARRHVRQARAVLRRADAVIVPSRFMERVVRGVHDRVAIHVIGHGPTDERPVARSASTEFVVTALARFVPVKGLDVLIDAFASALRDDATSRLVLAGEGPQRQALQSQVRALGIEDRVAFPGYVDGDARAALLGRTAVVAVPTQGDYETFGLAALDGRAAGCVVLVSAGGALPERVDAFGGIVVSDPSVTAWESALRHVRGDQRTRDAAVRDASRVLGENSWRRSASEHEIAYRRALKPFGT